MIAVRVALLLERLSRAITRRPSPVRTVTTRIQEARQRYHPRLEDGLHAAKNTRGGLEFIPRDEYFTEVERLLERSGRGR